MRCHK